MQNKIVTLILIVFLVCMTQAADESSHKKPKFDFDLNEPAIESEKDDSPASDSSRKREPEKGLSIDKSPLKWQRNQSKQRSNGKPIQDLSRIDNIPIERINPGPKGRRYKDSIPKEQYELSKKNKREAYALKSKEERQAISFKNRQYFEKRLANMTPEQRKEYEAKENQREQKYKPRRKLLRRKRYLLQKEKTS